MWGKGLVWSVASLGLCWGDPCLSTWPQGPEALSADAGPHLHYRYIQEAVCGLFCCSDSFSGISPLLLPNPLGLFGIRKEAPFLFFFHPKAERILPTSKGQRWESPPNLCPLCVYTPNFPSLWNTKSRESHSLLLSSALPNASFEAAIWLDTGRTMSIAYLTISEVLHCTATYVSSLLVSLNSSCVIIYECLSSLWYILWKLGINLQSWLRLF